MIAIYARQSIFKEDSISIESQVEHCKYEVEKEKYVVYEDKGYSGKNIERPRFKDMMDDIRAGKITKVVCYKLDRISRSLLDFAKIMEVFTEFNVEFVSMNEKFDTSTAMGRAMLNICIVFAQLERETIQLRVTDAYASRSKVGFYMGGRVPYGFKKGPLILNGKKTSQYEPVDEEVEQLKVLFEIYARPNTSLADVVRYFKENCIKKTRGVEWCASRITEIMRNPIYVKADMDLYNYYRSRNAEIISDASSFIGENGCYLYTKDVSKIAGRAKNMSQYDNMILVLAPHKGIIDSDIWIRCRLKAEQNVQIPNGRRAYTTWVSGKLKCLKCGYAMRYNRWTGKTSENEYYLCSAVPEGKCDGVGAVKKDDIESIVFEQLKLKIQSIKIEQSQPNPHQPEVNEIKVLIAEKEREIDKILDNFAYAIPAVIERMNKVVERLTDEISELNNQICKLETTKNSRNQLDTKAIETIFGNWGKVSKEGKQKVADILIKKILVSKERIEFVWKV